MKLETQKNLPILREVAIPEYFGKTISEEKEASKLDTVEVSKGISELHKNYSLLRNENTSELDPAFYSVNRRYIAYLIDRVPDYYPRISLVMNHLFKYTKFFELLNKWSENKVKILDIGAGPGTMSFAFIDYLENINQLEIFDFKYSLTVIEQENKFLEFITKLYNNLNEGLKEKITIEGPLESFRVDFKNLNETLLPKIKDKSFHVILLPFILNENRPNKDMIIDLFQLLKGSLVQEGILIFMEAPSDFLFKYMEIDFIKETGLFRNAPCLNGNKIYGIKDGKRNPFFSPCGDLCVFQVSEEERNKFCFLILSKEEFLSDKYNKSIVDSIEFFRKYEHHLDFNYGKKKPELGEPVNIFGILTNKENKNGVYDYYFCNGGCKLKIDGLKSPILNINEGDACSLGQIIYDGLYPKINRAHGKNIPKNYGEIGFKFKKGYSSYDVIPFFHP